MFSLRCSMAVDNLSTRLYTGCFIGKVKHSKMTVAPLYVVVESSSWAYSIYLTILHLLSSLYIRFRKCYSTYETPCTASKRTKYSIKAIC
jgi:hypothetical protein